MTRLGILAGLLLAAAILAWRLHRERTWSSGPVSLRGAPTPLPEMDEFERAARGWR